MTERRVVASALVEKATAPLVRNRGGGYSGHVRTRAGDEGGGGAAEPASQEAVATRGFAELPAGQGSVLARLLHDRLGVSWIER